MVRFLLRASTSEYAITPTASDYAVYALPTCFYLTIIFYITCRSCRYYYIMTAAAKNTQRIIVQL